ncbi:MULTISPECIES: TonB-dependent receptor plug domain-containing protein [unclassified Pseudoalteromonas]|uniref:TonB-dependent receptor plug domain-containing protein n=1 Tax=unclassified Pseudoalteromonas TaxID=194690 RepID=UPI0020976742|nr:TonB-dependent receptor plug domain-containing protein [Pseudoalteromonas sp. XMcav2-N]MCO7188938.1 TonB-dependent receptor plug domain-containing protein [Pseudoalteromonas sp. XMcav2-N]
MKKIRFIFLPVAQVICLPLAAKQLAPEETDELPKALVVECVGDSALNKKSREQLLECIAHKQRAQEIERIAVHGEYIGLQVPEVNGRYVLDRDFLEKTPHNAGDISELLGLLPGVILGDDAYDADLQAEIGAKRVSISGGQPWQTGFFLDGVNFNSRQDPSAYDRKKSTPNDVQGAVQAFNVNQQIVESIDVFTNNIPANYGGFSGGVVEVNTREADSGAATFGVNYRTSQSDWNEYHIIVTEEENEASSALPLAPVFEKNVYNLDFSTTVGEHHSVLFAANYTDSKISTISLNETVLTTRETANYLVKLTQTDLWLDKLSLSLNYSPYESRDVSKNVKHSEFTSEGGGYSTTLQMEQEVADILFAGKLSYVFSENSRKGPPHFYPWYKAKGKDWGVGDAAEFTLLSREGGYGSLYKTQKSLNGDFSAKFDEFSVMSTQHYLQVGIQLQKEVIDRKRHDSSFSYNSPITGISQLNCTAALFDCVELTTSMSVSELEKQLGSPLDLSNPDHILAYSEIVDTAPQYFALRTVYQQEHIDVDVQNISAYVTDDIEWKDITLRAGLRYDYDNFLKNHNLAPRLSFGYRVNGHQDTMLVMGLNRYYDSNLLTYKIREQQLPSLLQRRSINSEGVVELWQDLSSATDYRYRFTDAETPYSDELVLGWKQATDYGNFSVEYVKRWSKKQLRQLSEPEYNPVDGYYYRQMTNLGHAHNERVSLSWAWNVNAHSLWANTTYQLSQYTSSTQLEDIETAALNELVYLRTETPNKGYTYTETTKSNIELREAEFGEPLSLNVGWTASWTETLTTSLNTSYRQSYHAISALDLSRESSQIDRLCPVCQSDESLFIEVYQETKIPSRVLANLSFNWQSTIFSEKSVKFGVDIHNLFNSRTHSVNVGTSGVETGRSIWLSVGMEL